jgi:polysaccharide chain length determinant protein (PEP-CTERM system associated)
MPEDPELNLNETIGRIRRLVVRRRWWIFGPAMGITLATCGVLLLIPNRYTSEATLLVVQQQVPERYVAPNSTADIISTLQAMKRDVLSRTRMLKLVEDFDLYEKERKRLAPEQIANKALHDIEIEPLDESPDKKGFTAFKISFVANDPLLAQRVNSRLTSLFINEDLKAREQQSVSTTAFLHEQLEQKREALEAEDKQLRDLKMQFIGELPEQQQGNLGILASLQAQLQTVGTALSHAQEQQAYLQSLLNGYIGQATADLNQLRAKKAKLLETYRPQYPAVLQIDEEITKANNALQQLLQPDTTASAIPSVRSRVSGAGSEQLAATQLRSQLSANSLELANLTKQQTRLNNDIAEYQRRLNETPAREQQLLAITRDEEQLRKEYEDLGKKEQESQLATNLEKNQGGQQFRLADAPSLPVIPSSPKRLKASLGGAAAGFGFGIGLALFLDLKNRCFHSEGDVSRRLGGPMVIGLPLLLTPTEEKARGRRFILEAAVGCILALAVCAMEALVYTRG